MYYRGYLQPVACPRCETLNNQIREEYRFCGCPLENYCTDDECGELNILKARFCKKCGKPTVLMKARAFDEKAHAEMTEKARLYFLIYGDPDTPQAKAEQTRRQRETRRELRRYDRRAWQGGFDDNDCPEPPLDPDYIPYW